MFEEELAMIFMFRVFWKLGARYCWLLLSWVGPVSLKQSLMGMASELSRLFLEKQFLMLFIRFGGVKRGLCEESLSMWLFLSLANELTSVRLCGSSSYSSLIFLDLLTLAWFLSALL